MLLEEKNNIHNRMITNIVNSNTLTHVQSVRQRRGEGKNVGLICKQKTHTHRAETGAM